MGIAIDIFDRLEAGQTRAFVMFRIKELGLNYIRLYAAFLVVYIQKSVVIASVFSFLLFLSQP